MVQQILIIGAGGFAREVLHWARAAGHHVVGFVAPDDRGIAGADLGVGVVGDDAHCPVGREHAFVPAIGDPGLRRRAVQTLVARGARFLTVIHPTAIVASTARLGVGVVVCPYAIVSDAARVGDGAQINFHASVAHDARVGRFATLAPYAALNGGASIGDDVLVATHATVTAGKTVGRGARISANTAVHRDVAPGALVMAEPAKSRVLWAERA